MVPVGAALIRCASAFGRAARRSGAILGFVLALVAADVAHARGLGLIRDAEIETYLRELSAPVMQSAGINPRDVRIYLVNDGALNAFVAGGMNLFLNTGLIIRTETPEQLLGVIAHETGHIAGGHLTRVAPAQKRAAIEMIAAAILAAAAGVAGAPDVAGAIVAGGATQATAGLAKFSRGQEQAADQAAVTYLERTGITSEGLAEFLVVLEQENITRTRPPPYLLSHPLTRDRVSFVEQQAKTRGGHELDGAVHAEHARVRAKLQGFLDRPDRTLREYANDDSLPGRYAQAIAYYRTPDLQRALGVIDGLIADYPDDPYFHELKGQMLFEHGRVADAVAPYRQAVRYAPQSSLLHLGLGRALLESGAQADAIVELRETVRLEPSSAAGWRYLGIALGRSGSTAEADWALGESAYLLRELDDAELYVRRASQGGIDDPTARTRLRDLERAIADARLEERR